jgi:hypothetical protein
MIRILAFALLFASPAWAADVYDNTCAVPAAPAHVWHVAANGSTPDAAHGGIAVNGVMGTADGTEAHPFNSLAAVLHGGRYENPAIPGYSHPLLSTAPYDHYPKTGVNGQRRDHDWNPSAPDPTRINPGDRVEIGPGDWGALGIGYYSIVTSNVDAAGKTAFVSFVGDPNAIVTSVSVGGARGFSIEGFKVKSAGPFSLILVNITGGKTTPTRDIVFNATNIESFDSLSDILRAYDAYKDLTTDNPPKTLLKFIASNFKRAVYVGGDTIEGENTACIAVTNSHIHHMYTAFGLQGASKLLAQGNQIDHFSGDGVDLLTSYVRVAKNVFASAINDGSGAHPDTFQSQYNGQYNPMNSHDVVIDRNVSIERLDPDNPWPQNVTFAQIGAASGLVVTGNMSQTSNCPGLALNKTFGAVVSNNTVVGNGVIPFTGCGAVQSGETESDNNEWKNNVTAGRFYQQCNHSIWENNVQIPSRQGGVSYNGVLGWCDKNTNTIKSSSTDGDYNGVRIITTDSSTFAFTHYDPPQNGLSTLDDPDLHPVCGGPLVNCTPPIGAFKEN